MIANTMLRQELVMLWMMKIFISNEVTNKINLLTIHLNLLIVYLAIDA